MASQVSRAREIVSTVVLVAAPLCILLISSSSPYLAASPAPVIEAPERANLGDLRPTGRINPDGTEVWVPRDDSILVGSIEVDVRGDGRVVRQKVLRPELVPTVALGFSLSPTVEERVCSRSSTTAEGDAAATAEPDLTDPRRTEAAPTSEEWR